MTDALPGADIEPYGSVTDPALLDGWSDLDVVITSRAAFDVQEALQGRLWAFQSTSDGDAQVVRAVLDDGRRIDATIHGAPWMLPAPLPTTTSASTPPLQRCASAAEAT